MEQRDPLGWPGGVARHTARGDLFQDGVGVLPHRANLPQIERPAHGGPVPLAKQRPDVPGKAGDGVGGGGWLDGPGWDACFRLPTSGIVLVHRLAYDDWSFPKGKLDPGETEVQAALREVQEETGLRCRLGHEVGTAAYRDRWGRPKTVRYWEMTPTAGTLGPANEIDDARWVPLGEAPRLLSYERDRRLLDGWQPAG